MPLKSTFEYFGGKRRIAHLYEAPRYDLIIEPFAGSAGFSHLHHNGRDVILNDIDPTLGALWNYVLEQPARIEKFLSLPDWSPDLDWDVLPEGARALIGFWLAKGSTRPRRTPSPRSKWGEAIRRRLATQVPLMSRWKFLSGSYEQLPDVEATWFIDPPYQQYPYTYAYGREQLNYSRLADWVYSRKGQVIVCEGRGANWLPFGYLTDIVSVNHTAAIEQVYVQNQPRAREFISATVRQQSRDGYYLARYAGLDVLVSRVAQDLADAKQIARAALEELVANDLSRLAEEGRCIEVVPRCLYRIGTSRVLVTPAPKLW